jgi:hypothetical protein
MSNGPDLGPSIRLYPGWSATQPVKAVLAGDRVFVQGQVKNTSDSPMPAGSLIWMVPFDRRPPIEDWWICAATDPSGKWQLDSTCRVGVRPDGGVVLEQLVDAGVEISLAQINHTMGF